MKEYRDHYFLKAKQENYPARSVYKLKEMDAAFRLFRPGMRVLDLGAAPGSWTLYAAERVGTAGIVIGCDLQTTGTVFPANVRFLVETGPFDVVMSDMAPKTTGAKFTDQARSLDLCMEALAVADAWLKRGGHFIAKIFMGPDYRELADAMRLRFSVVKTFKPKSSRSESKEIFQVGMKYLGTPSEGGN